MMVISDKKGEIIMSVKNGESRELFDAELLALLRKKVSKSKEEILSTYIKRYYSSVALEDLSAYQLEDLCGAALSHWSTLEKRQRGEALVRIYNPDYEQYGWESTHTVIEVTHDDMPFLVDSVQMELNRLELTTHMIAHMGAIYIERNTNKEIIHFAYDPHKSIKAAQDNYDALIFIEIDRQTDLKFIEELTQSLKSILQDVTHTVVDWQPMLKKLNECIHELETITPSGADPDDVSESRKFLSWLGSDHFTFIGYREYKLLKKNGDYELQIIPNTGLGVLKNCHEQKISQSFASMTPKGRQLALSPQILILGKTNTPPRIHRAAIAEDSISVKQFDQDGNVIGEKRFIGLYTSAAYNRSPRDIPLLHQKVKTIMEESHYPPGGHDSKALLNILETLPRDDLFQASTKELKELAVGIVLIKERRIIRLFVREDIYGRFMSCLVFVPRDRFNTDLRVAIQNILMRNFNGIKSTFSTRFSDSILARIHFVIRISQGGKNEYDVKDIFKQIIDIARSWEDHLSGYLKETYGEERGNELIRKYAFGFPAGYRENNNPKTAGFDIRHFELLNENNSLEMSLFKTVDTPEGIIRFKLFTLNKPIPLSDVLPLLENMGLRVIGEQPYRIAISGGNSAWISDFSMIHANRKEINAEEYREVFQNAFAKIWFGDLDNDGLNKLVLSSKLNWRQISIFRAYKRLFKQIGTIYSQSYIEEVITKYPHVAALLAQLFEIRFALKGTPIENEAAAQALKEKILHEIDSVDSLDEDKILRLFFVMICATLRTNYFQPDAQGLPKKYFSFKLDPSQIPELPRPIPKYLIWVYSSAGLDGFDGFEAVHFRMSKVARGGLRWSDRREDFYTEILGLVKAQKVKNSLIVPSGAKGGFFITAQLPNDITREQLTQIGVRCYKNFIRGMLDITDNIIDHNTIPPKDVICYDEPDSYLVVAADKGTATFSNYANEVSKEYSFWLGDAFASGGAAGYDHKAMGITARGAWESVKRHFRELGLNTQQQAFTVVGIGDMAGDVFGNGMLLSDKIKLIAAFNHCHIFVDPNPNPEISFHERKRMFNLPRSSWADYNPALLSTGGIIYNRSAKSLALTDEIMALFDIQEKTLQPNEFIKKILTAKFDLLWNGGIGTFVKASTESHVDVGDKSNDAIRVNANQLYCKVIGEGGNLGCTQLARIEFSLHGGHLYTDAIDNSAGVDCSDHEVNIKILLNNIVRSGDMTEKKRNEYLANMTDEVAELVLRNNYLQTQAVSVSMTPAVRGIDIYARFIDEMEKQNKLDRQLEFLPDDKELAERKNSGQGLTRPELSVLMAYSKITLKEQILASSLPEDPSIATVIETAFPKSLVQDFKEHIYAHSLRREIIATQLSNEIVNMMGITFIRRVIEETGAPIENIVRAFKVAQSVFGVTEMWAEIEQLDYQVSTHVQTEMLLLLSRLIRRATRWFLRNHDDLTRVAEITARYMPGVALLYKNLALLLGETPQRHVNQLVEKYCEAGTPETLAMRVACSTAMFSVLDIIEASNRHQFSPKHVAKVYFALGATLELAWFRAQMTTQRVETHWEALACASFRDELDWQQRELTVGVLQQISPKKNITEAIDAWTDAYKPQISRWRDILTALRASTTDDFVMYAVALRCLLDLTQENCRATIKLEEK
jgi:glutamate dehydrogenase